MRAIDATTACLIRMRIEGSVMTSLAELRAIEEQRMLSERQSRIAEEEARVMAKAAAEQAIRDADAKRIADERAAALAIEETRFAAEREARMRVEAGEASERARYQASLDEARLAQEMEIALELARRTKPKWMIVVTIGAVLLAGALTWFAVDRMRAASEADRVAVQARLDADQNRKDIDELNTQLVALNQQQAANTTRLNKAIEDVIKAEGEAAAIAGRKRLQAEQAEQAAIAKRQAEIRDAIAKKKRNEKVDMTKCLQGGSIGNKDCL
jgi:hypothetical protein